MMPDAPVKRSFDIDLRAVKKAADILALLRLEVPSSRSCPTSRRPQRGKHEFFSSDISDMRNTSAESEGCKNDE